MAMISQLAAVGGAAQLATNMGKTPPTNISVNRMATLQGLSLIQAGEAAEQREYQTAILKENYKICLAQLGEQKEGNRLLGQSVAVAADSNAVLHAIDRQLHDVEQAISEGSEVIAGALETVAGVSAKVLEILENPRATESDELFRQGLKTIQLIKMSETTDEYSEYVERALAKMREAVEFDPFNEDALVQLGLLEFESGDHSGAIKHLREAVRVCKVENEGKGADFFLLYMGVLNEVGQVDSNILRQRPSLQRSEELKWIEIQDKDLYSPLDFSSRSYDIRMNILLLEAAVVADSEAVENIVRDLLGPFGTAAMMVSKLSSGLLAAYEEAILLSRICMNSRRVLRAMQAAHEQWQELAQVDVKACAKMVDELTKLRKDIEVITDLVPVDRSRIYGKTNKLNKDIDRLKDKFSAAGAFGKILMTESITELVKFVRHFKKNQLEDLPEDLIRLLTGPLDACQIDDKWRKRSYLYFPVKREKISYSFARNDFEPEGQFKKPLKIKPDRVQVPLLKRIRYVARWDGRSILDRLLDADMLKSELWHNYDPFRWADGRGAPNTVNEYFHGRRDHHYQAKKSCLDRYFADLRERVSAAGPELG